MWIWSIRGAYEVCREFSDGSKSFALTAAETAFWQSPSLSGEYLQVIVVIIALKPLNARSKKRNCNDCSRTKVGSSTVKIPLLTCLYIVFKGTVTIICPIDVLARN